MFLQDIYKGIFQTKSVCLKVLKMYVEDEEGQRNNDLHFYKETLLWTQLNDPNLLPFLGVNTTLFPGKLALVSPWMVNGEITKFLEVNPRHDRLTVISEIAAGILYLHCHNIVHGDIKGANVLVDEWGHCYLADFGLATAAMTCTLLSTVSTSGGGKGTMRWMAPELFTSHLETEIEDKVTDSIHQGSSNNPKHNNIKLARDIYAYACTVYEIVAGTVPFAHLRHDVQVMFQMLNGERPERPTATTWCPNNIWALVQQCWAQEIHLRPTAVTVHEFLKHLNELCGKGLPWEDVFLESIQADK
ncbi:kinase-like protein [Marasmius fiardii PR-910]|nr:kinase-like protein [Marasmius fiardii PR-910]